MTEHTFVDLFSGAGGMSFGFHAHPRFRVVAAVDLQYGKPSVGAGALDCNRSYKANIGVSPWDFDLAELDPEHLRSLVDKETGGEPVTVLSACPPCTGFSRANPNNHLNDDARNSLVARVRLFVKALQPQVFVLENARELLQGHHRHHWNLLRRSLVAQGYRVYADVHMLSRFGLPQRRERALIVACRKELTLRTIDELWDGYSLDESTTTVREAIEHLPPVDAGEEHPDDSSHVSPSIGTDVTLRRLRAIPHDGGSWRDLIGHPDADQLLTPAMKRTVDAGKFGSYPDIYGRMAWDRPSVTIKRECAHFGNGRYAHPEQDRLCTVREIALLTGFPSDYRFESTSVTNMYRHVGDAVPPLISHQLAWVVDWMLSGQRPRLGDTILDGCQLRPEHIVAR